MVLKAALGNIVLPIIELVSCFKEKRILAFHKPYAGSYLDEDWDMGVA